ncbi:acyltransferase [Vibrio alginolyticus]|uniref:acyltransferase n=1 Tax=Vibrio alginolyticus TaxID=663 RepID=UPI001BD4DD36|nr:acyltransferase [Vibrio alginolyticus]EJG0029266.1 acyltransferase [Vibrio alginolyticus]EMA2429722.1 acyltransferase [Vibrio alginolyticus]MBT0095455.1 acyltransferase [Vibrio alginolyticus]
MIRFFKKISSIIYTAFIKLIYFRKLSINPIKSHFSGRFFIDGKKSKVIIGPGFRTKGFANLNVRNGKVNIGSNVFFNLRVSINCLEEISIGSNCLIGENVVFYDHDHEFNNKKLIREQGFSCEEIVIGNNVWIGSGTIILKGTKIEDNSIIAAGSILKGYVPKNSLFIQKRTKEIHKIMHY